jgi:hypothetical protein
MAGAVCVPGGTAEEPHPAAAIWAKKGRIRHCYQSRIFALLPYMTHNLTHTGETVSYLPNTAIPPTTGKKRISLTQSYGLPRVPGSLTALLPKLRIAENT